MCVMGLYVWSPESQPPPDPTSRLTLPTRPDEETDRYVRYGLTTLGLLLRPIVP